MSPQGTNAPLGAEHRIAVGDEARRAEEHTVRKHQMIRALEGRNIFNGNILRVVWRPSWARSSYRFCPLGSRLLGAHPGISYVTPLAGRLPPLGALYTKACHTQDTHFTCVSFVNSCRSTVITSWC